MYVNVQHKNVNLLTKKSQCLTGIERFFGINNCKTPEALEYLSIAQGLAQERNEHLDYSALIMRYKEKINSQKEKRFI